MITIKNRNGDVICESEKEILKEAVEECAKNKMSLQGADLRGASLGRAYLQGASLQGTNLRGADLQGADLREAIGLNKYLS